MSDPEFHPAFSAIKVLSYRYVILDGNANVSIAVSLHTIEFIFEFYQTWTPIISKHRLHLIVFLLHRQSSFDVEKTFAQQMSINFAAVRISVSYHYVQT